MFDKAFNRKIDKDNNMETNEGETLFSCNMCEKTFSTEDTVKTHIMTHDKEIPLVCEVVDEAFRGVDQENHIETHAGDTLFSCNMCEKTFSTEDSVKTHIMTHDKETPLVCEVVEAFRGVDQENHIETHAGDTLFSCNICEKTFQTEDTVKTHIMTHDKETPLVCEVVDEAFRGVDEENHIETRAEDTLFSCNMHEKTFLTEDSVKTHIVTHIEETPLICEVVDETFRGVDQENHVEPQTGETLFSCNMCEKTFLTEDSVKIHIATHDKETPLVCEVVDEAFRGVDEENHIETHMGDTLFSCNTCKKTFLTEDSVKTHIMIHDEETPLACEEFDETFREVDQENNIETHTGETIFSCNMCEKTFSTEDCEKNHITTHVEETPLVFEVFDETFRGVNQENNIEPQTGETLFSCNMCEKTFLTEDSVKTHIATHEDTPLVCEMFDETLKRVDQENHIETQTGETLFSCNMCEKTFSTEDSVKAHITTHVEETPLVFKVFDETFRKVDQENHMEINEGETLFSCDICKTSFSTKDDLKNHLMTHEETSVVDKTFSRKIDTETGSAKTPYSCNICEKTFSTEDCLKRHITTHDADPLICKMFETLRNINQENHMETNEGETLFPCDMCKISFSTKDSLKNHIMRHEETSVVDKTSRKKDKETGSAETLFSCNICEKTFSTEDVLKSHIKIHDKETALVCKVFDKTFSRNVDMETHAAETPFSCNICEKTFFTDGGLKTHIKTHDTQSSLVCKVSDETFRKVDQENHMETNERETLFPCDICKTSFSTKDGLKNHIMTHEETSVVHETFSRKVDTETHTTETTFSSNMSDKAFPTEDDLKSHFKTEVGENPFVCEVCGKQFSRKAKLKSHMRIHSGKNSYCCDMCEKNFSHTPTEDTRSHIQIHTGENTKKKKKRENSHSYKMYKKNFSHNPIEEARFSCQVCDEAFFQKVDLETHIKSHTEVFEMRDIYFDIKQEVNPLEAYTEEIEKVMFHCEVCGDAFLMKDDLEAHLKNHTTVTPFQFEMFNKDLSLNEQLYSLETQTGNYLHTCVICDKTFSKKELLIRHVRIHTGESPFTCTLCGKGFSYNCTLKNHMRIHTNELPFPCAFCSKAFSRKDKLQVHIRTHTGETPYSCGICGKSFSHRSSLNTHMVIHTGENEFICIVCAKAFSRKEKLKLHMRTHTGETPYPCTICNKAFSYNCTLKNHMKIHTGELPFPCAVCGKAFSRKDKLQSHVRIHTGETPYPCKFCTKAFSHNVSLKTHMRIHAEEISICV